MATTNYIYVIKEHSFDIDGVGKFDCSSIDIHLAMNTIPTATVLVAPEKSRQGKPTIHALSLEALKSKLDKVCEAATKDTTANLKIELTIYKDGPNQRGIPYKLELKDWVLVSAGLSRVTTTHEFALACTIAHPAARLTRYGGFYLNLAEELDPAEYADGVENVLDAASTMYEALAGAERAEILTAEEEIGFSGKDSDAIMDDVQEVFDKAAESVEECLEWDPDRGGGSGNAFPCEDSLDEDMLLGLKMAVCDQFMPQVSSTIWDSVMSACGLLGLAIYPEYKKEKLVVGPRNEWTEPELLILDRNVTELNLPGFDSDPVYGVRMIEGVDGFQAGLSTYPQNGGENLDMPADQLAFVPSGVDKACGKLVTVRAPAWIIAMQAYAASLSSPEPGESDDSEETSGDNENIGEYNDVKMRVLASYFMTLFHRGLEASIVAPLTLTGVAKSGEEKPDFVPGKVASFMTGEKTVLFEGYVTTVSHHIDCSSSSATTTVRFSHCRPEGGYDFMSGADENPLY